MAVDKKKNIQKLVTLEHELHSEIVEFQFSNRIKNESEAIRELIRRGLKDDK